MQYPVIIEDTLYDFGNGIEYYGGYDDRVPSNNPKIAKLFMERTSNNCTAFLISNRCLLTAGHCAKSTLSYIQFDTDNSLPQNRFEVDQNSVVWENSKIDDYAVFKTFPNSITGKYPGEQRDYLDLNFKLPLPNTPISIIGYGKDDQPERNHIQQIDFTALDYIVEDEGVLVYKTDSNGGTSGGPIINTDTNEVIGIHTNGATIASGPIIIRDTHGTSLALKHELRKAVNDCIEKE